MGCVKSKEREKAAKEPTTIILHEKDKIEMSQFTDNICKREVKQSRPHNYQSFQAAVKLPLFKDNKAFTLPKMSDFDIL
jgi:hypothetical protein